MWEVDNDSDGGEAVDGGASSMPVDGATQVVHCGTWMEGVKATLGTPAALEAGARWWWSEQGVSRVATPPMRLQQEERCYDVRPTWELPKGSILRYKL